MVENGHVEIIPTGREDVGGWGKGKGRVDRGRGEQREDSVRGGRTDSGPAADT